MKRNKKILTLTAKAALALSLVSVSTSALVQSNHVQAATQSTESKGFMDIFSGRECMKSTVMAKYVG